MIETVVGQAAFAQIQNANAVFQLSGQGRYEAAFTAARRPIKKVPEGQEEYQKLPHFQEKDSC